MRRKSKGEILREKIKEALVPADECPYEVPENWCWTYLGEVVEIKRGASPRPIKEYITDDENGTNWIKIGDADGTKYISCIKEKITEEGVKKSVFVKKGTLLLSNSMSFGHPYILNVDGCIHDGWLALKPSEYFDKEYLYYSLLSSDWYFEKVAVGTAVRNLNSDRVARTPIPLPPLAEQERIVDRVESLFAKLDEAKEKVQQVLDESENRRSAILYKAYSGAYTEKWRKENNVSRSDWNKVKLKDVCKINPPKINTKEFDDNLEVSFFPMASLSEVTGTIVDPQTRKLSEVRTGFTNFMEGDVVFAKITPCMENGKSAIIGELVNGIGYGTTEFYVFRCTDRLLNGYLFHLLRSKHFRDDAKAVMTGAVGQQRVPKSYLEEFVIDLPSLDEQKEILKIVDDCILKEQSLESLCEKMLDNIQEMKKSILAKAFRGELGTNNPSDGNAIFLLKNVLEEECGGE